MAQSVISVVLSRDPEANALPSSLIATQYTSLRCANDVQMTCPDLELKRRTPAS